MDTQVLGQLTHQALVLVLIVSAPLVGAAAMIGLLFGLLQALTQLQDQTTMSAVKLFVVFGLLMLLSPWLGAMIYEYGEQAFTLILEAR